MRDILRINGAVFLADFVCKSKDKRPGTGGRIINGDIFDTDRHHDFCNNTGNGVGRIVFSVFTEIFVIVFNQVLENLCKEIILLLKNTFKTAIRNFVDDSTAKAVFLFDFNSITC